MTHEEAAKILEANPVIAKLHWSTLTCRCGEKATVPNTMPGIIANIQVAHCEACGATLPDLVDLDALQAQLDHAARLEPDMERGRITANNELHYLDAPDPVSFADQARDAGFVVRVERAMR